MNLNFEYQNTAWVAAKKQQDEHSCNLNVSQKKDVWQYILNHDLFHEITNSKGKVFTERCTLLCEETLKDFLFQQQFEEKFSLFGSQNKNVKIPFEQMQNESWESFYFYNEICPLMTNVHEALDSRDHFESIVPKMSSLIE